MRVFGSILLTVLVGACGGGLFAAPSSGKAVMPEDGKAVANIDMESLIQNWVHSREEDGGDGVEVYRPENLKKFPPSRFRGRYRFSKDGVCTWLYLSPRDAHKFVSGTWSLAPEDKGILRIAGPAKTRSYRLIELTPDILRWRYVSPRR